jgi:branched-chain amino acid transport system permease protein
VAAYTVSAGLAGLAGGLHAQSAAFVTIDAVGFARSGTALIMLVLGGSGRLYGAFLGTAVYMVLEHELSRVSPAYWGLGVGAVLLAVVLFAREGLTGALARLRR